MRAHRQVQTAFLLLMAGVLLWIGAVLTTKFGLSPWFALVPLGAVVLVFAVRAVMAGLWAYNRTPVLLSGGRTRVQIERDRHEGVPTSVQHRSS